MDSVCILIVEDEFIISERLADNLKNVGYLITDIVTTGEDALNSVKNNTPDIIIMDIKLNGKLDGIQTAKKINESYSIPIIYLTNYSDNLVFKRAKQTLPMSYLTKPYTQHDVNNAIELALCQNENLVKLGEIDDKIDETSLYVFSDRIFVKDSKNCFNKLDIEDIIWIEGGGSYSTINTKGGTFTTSYNLKAIEKKISNKILMRVHRSFIINLSKIERIVGRDYIILDFVETNSMKDTHALKGEKQTKPEKKKISIGSEYKNELQNYIRLL